MTFFPSPRLRYPNARGVRICACGTDRLPAMESFDAKAIIKEIGRGARGARDLSRADAEGVFGALLDERIDPLQLAGLLAAIAARSAQVDAPDGSLPVVLPSYNGARSLPNLVPLLAMLLAREG